MEKGSPRLGLRGESWPLATGWGGCAWPARLRTYTVVSWLKLSYEAIKVLPIPSSKLTPLPS